MIRWSILFFALASSSISQAENSQILKCHVINREWNAIFFLDSLGSGFLKLNKSGETQSYTCALKLDYINDGQRAIVPNIKVDFTLASCDPELGEWKSEILKQQNLIVDLKDKSKPAGNVQWLRSQQPEDCKVEKLSMLDLQMGAQRFLKGQWGRTPASLQKPTK